MVLLTIIKKIQEKEKHMRFLILGLDNAGKTTILKKLNNEDTSEISPTLGFSIKTLCYEGYQLNFWDVGGQKSLRSYWRNYFEQTDALIWVVDSTDFDRLEDCKKELHNLLKEERLSGASLLILANKQDVKGSFSKEQLTIILDLQKIKTHHWYIQECSAVTGENLVTGIRWVVKDVCSRIFLLS
ncbi:ADP-ribosylation factor-like protein 2 [Zophobas morio]|uniref:ADP-ribosylation factor-like protein 2 n=1 Tax=Zophobas morio TaxID=2755281 RepID=UPI003082AAFE